MKFCAIRKKGPAMISWANPIPSGSKQVEGRVILIGRTGSPRLPDPLAEVRVWKWGTWKTSLEEDSRISST